MSISTQFKYCLNTSTIMGQKLDIKDYVEITAQAGYDSIELWVEDVKRYQSAGKSLSSLKKLISDSGLTVSSAIGFAPWMHNDYPTRKLAFVQMAEEMEMMASLDCTRIAAPPMGMDNPEEFNLFDIGSRYSELIELGNKTGVNPLLEFWGASPTLYHIGQALMAVAISNQPNTKILPDIYHLHRGGSGLESIKALNTGLIDIIHINDYPGDVLREDLTDANRVFPGDGVAPVRQIVEQLSGDDDLKILSLELFNETYWQQDPLLVAKTGLDKMKALFQ